MRDKVREELFRLEREKNIHIINAHERGSRMLAVSHEESDWDVLFVFAQDASVYAKIHGHIDSIHEPHLGENDQIDLHGWNIDKFGGLLLDSNPNAIEYCIPSFKYITYHGPSWEPMAEDAKDNFNHMSLYHHYISMGKRNWKKYVDSGNDCTKGRQFYVARAVACARFIRTRGDLPPMNAFALASVLEEENHELGRVLRKLATAKVKGHGEQENPDIVGPLYKAESETPMDPTDERIRSPDASLIDNFIEETVVR